MKPLSGAPTGERLEWACHQGAAMLLVPNHLLRRELKKAPRPLGATCLVQLAEFFGVSLEVAIRRAHDAKAFEERFAPVLVRRQPKGIYTLEYAAYPPWLKALLPTPRRGLEFTKWFGDASAQPGGASLDAGHSDCWTKETAQGILAARPVDITGSLRVVELQVSRTETS